MIIEQYLRILIMGAHRYYFCFADQFVNSVFAVHTIYDVL